MKDIKYWIWFSRIDNISNKQKLRLLEVFHTPEKLLSVTKECKTKIDGVDENWVNKITKYEYRQNLDKYLEYILKNNIHIITLFDERYPKLLNNIYDRPIVLYAKGNVNLLRRSGIAVVGCRNCSSYGKNVALKLSYDLAKHNITIISGLARGIDTYSHIGALEAGGNTIAVIGNGIDYIYPYENKNLCERIINNNGLIVTEYIVGTRPQKDYFPARNRIISGLSQGVVVVEAKEKSGALITADFALEQGKDVFAVPGNINSLNSYGTNDLIKQGAYVLTDFADITKFYTDFDIKYNKY